MFDTSLVLGRRRIEFHTNFEEYHRFLEQLFIYQPTIVVNVSIDQILHIDILDCRNEMPLHDPNIDIQFDTSTVRVNESRKYLCYEEQKTVCKIYVLVKSAEALYYTYILPSLKVCLGRNHTLSIHASSLFLPNGTGMMAVSPSGGGKSTLSFILNHFGCRLINDDISFIDLEDESVTGYYRPMHVDYSLTELMPSLSKELKDSKPYMSGSTKYNYRYHASEQIYRAVSIPAIFILPVIVNQEETQIIQLNWMEAFKRILSQVYFDSCIGREDINLLLEKLRTKNVYLLLLGKDMLIDTQNFAYHMISYFEKEGGYNEC